MSSEHDNEIHHMIDPTVPDLSKAETLRHSAAHVLAHAIKRLWPTAQLGFGPHTEDGFYYDIELGHRLTPDDFAQIEAEMSKIVASKFPFEREEISREQAQSLFSEMGESLKVEAIAAIPGDAQLTLYRSGDFVDLCRGPHVKHTGELRAFKVMRLAGAYWRGDESRPMLQRIYGTAFSDPKELRAHLAALEEAKKRDHRKLGTELGLFHFDPIAPASPFFTGKGATIYNLLQTYVRRLYAKHRYDEVITPQIFDMDLFKTSGHYDHYKENMFACEIDDREYGVKPMNCPSHCVLFRQSRHSYRELPIRMADFGRLHRYERAGSTHGLTRVRSFCQDDAHVFCRPDQIEAEILGVTSMILECYRTFGFDAPEIFVSTRPSSFLGEAETWDRAEEALKKALSAQGLAFTINHGDGAFYGPKIDFVVRDALRRPWQLGTVQLDFQLPERFDLEFVGSDDGRERPVMIHRAMLGSLERFFGVYLEHTAGKFPTWIAPIQVAVLAIASDHHDFCKEAEGILRSAGIRVEMDLRGEKLGLKIREATLRRVPYMLIIGDNEVAARSVAPRHRDGVTQPTESIESFTQRIAQEAMIPA